MQSLLGYLSWARVRECIVKDIALHSELSICILDSPWNIFHLHQELQVFRYKVISAFDSTYLGLFWMLNTRGWLTFYFHFQHLQLFSSQASIYVRLSVGLSFKYTDTSPFHSLLNVAAAILRYRCLQLEASVIHNNECKVHMFLGEQAIKQLSVHNIVSSSNSHGLEVIRHGHSLARERVS